MKKELTRQKKRNEKKVKRRYNKISIQGEEK